MSVVTVVKGVETYPIKGGIAAYSRGWGLTAAGDSVERAVERLSEMIAAFEAADAVERKNPPE